jgi:menaquinone-dependent protoporphyrinogen IX oxidase
MKLWIIYKNGIGYSRIIAEMLQDRLENYIDVDVGDSAKIEPAFIFEENIDYLILGDIILKEIPSLEIQKWLVRYQEISNKQKNYLKAISGYYIALADISIDHFWIQFIQDNIKSEEFNPPILRLNLKETGMEFEDGALELISKYSKDFIEFIITH